MLLRIRQCEEVEGVLALCILDPPRRCALVELTNIAYTTRKGRPDCADKQVSMELEKLHQPSLGVDTVRGQIEELAVLLQDKKLSQLKDLVVPSRLAHINRTRETSVDAAIGVVYGVPDHSSAPGTPAVWALYDWPKEKWYPGRISVFEEPESNEPVPSSYRVPAPCHWVAAQKNKTSKCSVFGYGTSESPHT